MPRKVVSLSVHRNTRDRRRRREMRGHMLRSVKLANKHELDGFALLAWTKSHAVVASWDTGSIPGFVVPEFVRSGLEVKMQETTISGDEPEPETS